MKKKISNLENKLSRKQMKQLSGGLFEGGEIGIELFAGPGNSVQRCVCVGSTAVFYCCYNSLQACVTENGCGNSYVCSKNTSA